MDIDPTVFYGLGGSVMVAALVQVVKVTFGLSDSVWARFIPVTAIVLGIAWNALLSEVQFGNVDKGWQILFLGLFAGLSAIGMYSGQQVTRNGS